MEQDIISTIGIGGFGVFSLFVGISQFRTYLKRRKWPLVQASLEMVDGRIDVTPTGEDIAIQPAYVHELHYLFHGHPYTVKLSERRLISKNLKLRVNPERPEEAEFDDRKLIFPVLAVCAGVVFIGVAMANRG